MKQSLLAIRILMLAISGMAGGIVVYVFTDLGVSPFLGSVIGLLIGALLILVDLLMKGFSLRALSALTFGLFVGSMGATFISNSPLFEFGDPQVIFISRVAVYVVFSYLATIIALRGKDEFNIVIPYVKFEPQSIEIAMPILDSSCLVDGRVAKLAKARLLNDILTVPKFVIDELHELASSEGIEERNRGKRGLKTLNEMRQLEHLEVRTYESEVERDQSRDEKMLYIVSSIKGRLLSTSETLIRRAKLEGVPYVDLLTLSKSLSHEVVVGESLSVKMVKQGKEESQAVGYLEDGSMVVVNGGADYVDSKILIEVESIIPTSGGRLVFGKLLGEDK